MSIITSALAELVAHTGPRLMIAGASGLVGQALQRQLLGSPVDLLTPNRSELDCTRQADVEAYFSLHQPDCLIIAAGRVGGIWANQQFPADFAYDNLMINTNLLQAARQYGVKRVMILGSSCIYPKYAAQPIAESALLTGSLEPSNEAYAMAKLAALKLAHSYLVQYNMDIRALMPTNLYGPGDRFDALQSHVVPALLLRMLQTISRGNGDFSVWGTGQALREFLFVDDLACAVLQVLSLPQQSYRAGWVNANAPSLDEFFYNVGSDDEVSIADLVKAIVHVSGYQGRVHFDASKPDGTPRKRLDCSRLHRLCEWRARISLNEGLALTWRYLLQMSSHTAG